LFFVLKKQKKSFLLLALGLILSWFFVISGKGCWYPVLVLPFVYLSLAVLLKEKLDLKIKLTLALILFLNLLANFRLHSYLLLTIGKKDHYSYKNFTQEILKIIPEGKTVFLSVIPNPYFGFKEAQRSNRLYEFPVTATDRKNYTKVLDDSDFVIYNRSYEEVVYGDFLWQYLERNKLRIYKIGQPFQYQTSIIELKPKSEREEKF